MIGLGLTVLGFAGATLLARRRLADGLGWVLGCGYFYGILRANFLDGASHFLFDGAVLGLYLGHFLLSPRPRNTGEQPVRRWFWLLFFWPFCMVLLSPLLDSQHVLIQLVGLRAAILMLPFLLLAARLDGADLERLAGVVVWLNLAAFGMALVQWVVGIEPFFPRNAATEIMYNSADVGEEGLFRIPSIFSSAHAFGGTMVASLPLLLLRLDRPEGRSWTQAAVAATIAGCFVCAARTPVVLLAVMAAVLLVTTRKSLRAVASTGVTVSGIAWAVATNERLQRFLTLSDVEEVEARVGGSMNLGLMDIVSAHPMGAGLGSASGTSVPYFLLEHMRPQVGLESEVSRLVLEQGLMGLLLWALFLGWILLRLPGRSADPRATARWAMWGLVLGTLLSAQVGTGTFTAIPGTMLLMLALGVLGKARGRAAV